METESRHEFPPAAEAVEYEAAEGECHEAEVTGGSELGNEAGNAGRETPSPFPF